MSNVFLKALIGSKQSKYTAMAIIATLIIISLAILFVESDVSYTNRVVLILFILLVSLPGILLSLVELTCLISGGSYSGANKPSWCWVLAWIIAIVTILYCVLIVISTFNTLFTYKKANHLSFLIIYLILLSIVLELMHYFIPVRSFELSDLFGNLTGVIIVIIINYFIKKYEKFKS